MSKTRPLSPHLQIYKLPLPAVMSISHRLSGVALSSGTILLAIWLLCLAGGQESFAIAQMVTSHWFGQLVLFGYSVALFYHMCNGIRHLFWDAGKGLEIESVYRSGRIALGVAALLCAGFWFMIFTG